MTAMCAARGAEPIVQSTNVNDWVTKQGVKSDEALSWRLVTTVPSNQRRQKPSNFGQSYSLTHGGICRGEAGELPPSLDLTFPPTGLSENLGGMERGGEGRERGKGRVGRPPALLPRTGFCLKHHPGLTRKFLSKKQFNNVFKKSRSWQTGGIARCPLKYVTDYIRLYSLFLDFRFTESSLHSCYSHCWGKRVQQLQKT